MNGWDSGETCTGVGLMLVAGEMLLPGKVLQPAIFFNIVDIATDIEYNTLTRTSRNQKGFNHKGNKGT